MRLYSRCINNISSTINTNCEAMCDHSRRGESRVLSWIYGSFCLSTPTFKLEMRIYTHLPWKTIPNSIQSSSSFFPFSNFFCKGVRSAMSCLNICRWCIWWYIRLCWLFRTTCRRHSGLNLWSLCRWTWRHATRTRGAPCRSCSFCLRAPTPCPPCSSSRPTTEPNCKPFPSGKGKGRWRPPSWRKRSWMARGWCYKIATWRSHGCPRLRSIGSKNWQARIRCITFSPKIK